MTMSKLENANDDVNKLENTNEDVNKLQNTNEDVDKLNINLLPRQACSRSKSKRVTITESGPAIAPRT